jgi:ATP-dependent Clp protease ATP-binding subunit ClpX
MEGCAEGAIMGKHHCNFCHKSEDEVKHLIVGPNNLGACDECLGCLVSIMGEADKEWRDRQIEVLTNLNSN